MSDHYVKVKVQLEQMKSSGGHAEKDDSAVGVEEPVPVASVPPVPACISTATVDAPRTSITSTFRGRNRSEAGDDEKNTDSQQKTDVWRGPAIASHVGRNPTRLRPDPVLQIKGTGKRMQEKQETNGNHRDKDNKEMHRQDGHKLQRKKRPVTVDTSKAKTSLEALKLSIKQLNWREFPFGRRAACDIYWHGVSFHDTEKVVSGQVNKFPGMIEMLRKINLSRAVRTMQELFPEEYDFYPRSWILPEEHQQFSAQFRKTKESHATLSGSLTFIVKPDGGSQGEGIYLIRDPGDLRLAAGPQAKQQVVVQEYVQKPLLIDKLKFDIRLYVLLRSLQPLEVYIAKEGLTRFCTEAYQEPTQKNLSHVFMHLTNYSLNVQSDNFVRSDSLHTGSKRTFSSVLYRLASKGVDIKRVWSDIIALVIKTVIALVPELKVYYKADIPPGKPGPTCFQILGFDILLTKNLKPVLLEVNSNPSMRIEHEQEIATGVFEYVPSPVDEEVKVCVIRDTLRLVDPGENKPVHRPGGGGGDPGEVIPIKAGSPPEKASADEDDLPSLCLKQVYPKYTGQFRHLCLVERIADLFLRFLGIKGNMRLGPTAFRTFIRCCKLSNANLPMASVDILYIDITRRWSAYTPDSREAGMGLQAFVEAFFYLAARRFKPAPLRDQVLSLLELCEAHLESHPPSGGGAGPAEERRSLSCSRALPRCSGPTQASSRSAPQLCSPAAARHDHRLQQRSKRGSLGTHPEN